MMAIEIVPYHPEWPDEFEKIAATVRAALGEMALRVDHIGSTSVPGLDAKDIIDVQVSVRQFDAELDAAFGLIGYTRRADIANDHRPPGTQGGDEEWEKRYYTPPLGQRPTHMHVRILGRANQRYPLLFRDYLRTHPAVAAGYAAFKHRLVSYFAEDRLSYTLIKDPVCDIIMAEAEEWAQIYQWRC
jgi:GrpB-like predicted nucleotidyltransferase (UPF0157 family)